MTQLSACFRMYNANPAIWTAWQRLFSRVFDELKLDIVVIDHIWPDPLSALWSRADLGCAFMCGWPYAGSNGSVQPIVVPVPSPPQYLDQPRYRSEFLTRASSGWTTLEETFGHRIGWMVEDSQSGFNAPRHHLAPYAARAQAPLFSEVKGPLGNPNNSLAALRQEKVDVISLDSFFLDLLRHHKSEALDALHTVGYTDWTPMPLLVAADKTPVVIVDVLATKLVGLDREPVYRELLDAVLVRRFARPEIASYQSLEHMAQVAHQLDYDMIR